jgi:hypothetical protein
MTLHQFVETSLKEIISGVRGAQDFAKTVSDGARINPPVMYSADSGPKGKHYATPGDANLVQFVDFDVAVTIDSATEAKGGGGIKVYGLLSAEGGGSSSDRNSTVSRIKFSVPVALPKTAG